jgi:hypothetical protein
LTVYGTTPDTALTFTLYFYSDTGTPIAQTLATSFNNLNSGDYLLEVKQTLGDLENSQSADATINDETSALDFEIEQIFSGNWVLQVLK